MKSTENVLPKRILVDANFLVALLKPETGGDLYLRAKHLVERLEKQKGILILPMPALAEYLVGADAAGLDSVHAFERKKYVLLAPFDRVSAFECAMLDRGAMNGPQQDKRDGATQPWQLVKVDRQIIAIGKANGATVFVTRDGRARTTAMRCGMAVWELADLPLSPEDQQTKLPLALPKGSQRGTPAPG